MMMQPQSQQNDPFFDKLSVEIILNILCFSDVKELAQLCLTSKRFFAITTLYSYELLQGEAKNKAIKLFERYGRYLDFDGWLKALQGSRQSKKVSTCLGSRGFFSLESTKQKIKPEEYFKVFVVAKSTNLKVIGLFSRLSQKADNHKQKTKEYFAHFSSTVSLKEGAIWCFPLFGLMGYMGYMESADKVFHIETSSSSLGMMLGLFFASGWLLYGTIGRREMRKEKLIKECIEYKSELDRLFDVCEKRQQSFQAQNKRMPRTQAAKLTEPRPLGSGR